MRVVARSTRARRGTSLRPLMYTHLAEILLHDYGSFPRCPRLPLGRPVSALNQAQQGSSRHRAPCQKWFRYPLHKATSAKNSLQGRPFAFTLLGDE